MFKSIVIKILMICIAQIAITSTAIAEGQVETIEKDMARATQLVAGGKYLGLAALLSNACNHNNLPLIQYIFDNAPAETFQVKFQLFNERFVDRAFVKAAFVGNVDILTLFLERTDVDVSYMPNESMANAIIAVIHSRKQAAVELLLAQDPDLTVADYNGHSAYFAAYSKIDNGDFVTEQDKKIFRMVVAAGANMKPHEESAIKQSIVDQVLGEAGL